MSVIDMGILMFVICSLPGILKAPRLLAGELFHPVFDGRERITTIVVSFLGLAAWYLCASYLAVKYLAA